MIFAYTYCLKLLESLKLLIYFLLYKLTKKKRTLNLTGQQIEVIKTALNHLHCVLGVLISVVSF